MNVDMTVSVEEAARAIGTLSTYARERLVALGIGEASEEVQDHQLDSTIEAVRMMNELYQTKEAMQAQVKTPIERGYDYLRFTVVPKMMETDDVTSLTVAGVGRVNIMDDVQVKVQDKGELHRWLIDHELEDMIVPNVNAQTLTAFVRKRVREAAELPPEKTLTYKPIVRAQITRSAG